MRDVATAANVSQSTVSRILTPASSPISISEETRKRVMDVVNQLGYHPNLYAGSLRGQKVYMIAMMIADITNSFYHPMVRAVQDVAHQHRYDVMIANSDHLRANEVMFCESIMRRPVDGIIMVPYNLSNEEIGDLVHRTGVPVVVLGSHVEHELIDTVFANDGEATYQATQWLIKEKGHQRIGYIGVTRSFITGQRRWKGYARALQEAGLPVPSAYTEIGDWSLESGKRAAATLLKLPEPPTALLACNDYMAIGAIFAAQEMGLRVPDDIAIIGFDNIAEASWVHPALTTIAQFPTQMGQEMSKLLFARMEGTLTGPRRFAQVPCQFIERNST